MRAAQLVLMSMLSYALSVPVRAGDEPVWKDDAALERLKQEAVAKECVPIYYDKGYTSIRQAVKGTGDHCVIHDFVQRKVWSLDDGRQRGNPEESGVLSFYQAENANLDLGGHLISGAPFENMIGITAYGLGFFNHKTAQRTHLTVRNGRIVTPGLWSAAIKLAPYAPGGHGYKPKPELQKHDREDAIPEQLVTGGRLAYTPWNYLPPTHYTLDNLTIESGGRGVVLSGANNAVRNSTIEVESKVAMVSYGPNLVIENNTFIIQGGEDVYSAPETQAILKLRDADNAIIRNNRFIAKGVFTTCPAAINLINSKAVLIENNTVEGCKQLLRKDDASTAMEQGNVLP